MQTRWLEQWIIENGSTGKTLFIEFLMHAATPVFTAKI